MSFIIIPKQTLSNLRLPDPLFPCCQDFLQFLDKDHGTERRLGSVGVVLLKTEEEIFILLKGMHQLHPLDNEKITSDFKAVLRYIGLENKWFAPLPTLGVKMDVIYPEIDFVNLG